jgi:hypothetical protein
MNIQELNHNGQPIWVFVATSVAIFVCSLWIWGLFYQWNKYIHAPRVESLYAFDQEFTADSSWRRMGLLLWLLFHGHVIWTWRSGIFFSLMSNGAIGFTPTCQNRDELCDSDIGPVSLKYAKEDVASRRYPTHSPFGPSAYIRCHADRGNDSVAAFSFARAN